MRKPPPPDETRTPSGTHALTRAISVEDPAELPTAVFDTAATPAAGEAAVPATPNSTAPQTGNRLTRILAQARGRLSYALGDQVVYSFGNMVVAALLSRHGGARLFGVYILTQRTLDILIQLSNTLSWAPFTFHLPGTAAESKASYRGSIFLQQALLCLLTVPVLAVVAHLCGRGGHGVSYGTFRPLVFSAGTILFREFNRRMYFAEMRMREAFWTETATVALQVAGVCWLLHSGRLDVTNTLLALSFGAAALGLWWLLREWHTLRFGLGTLLADTARNLRLGRWLLGSNFVFLASNQANPWLLGAAFGGAGVGAYAVCESIVNIPRVALVSLQNVFAPMLARAYEQGGKALLRERVARIDRALLLGSTAAAAGIVAAGPWVARGIFGKSIPGDARLILLFLGLNFVAFAGTLAQSYALTAIDRAGPTLVANVAGLAAQGAAAWFLVRHFQVPGAAAALLLGSAVVALVRGHFYRRELPRDTPRYTPRAAIAAGVAPA